VKSAGCFRKGAARVLFGKTEAFRFFTEGNERGARRNDRPRGGLINISQQPMVDLQQSLRVE